MYPNCRRILRRHFRTWTWLQKLWIAPPSSSKKGPSPRKKQPRPRPISAKQNPTRPGPMLSCVHSVYPRPIRPRVRQSVLKSPGLSSKETYLWDRKFEPIRHNRCLQSAIWVSYGFSRMYMNRISVWSGREIRLRFTFRHTPTNRSMEKSIMWGTSWTPSAEP